MKIAISGKGGVGKSTVAAVLALMLAKRGGRVLALDCDPDANLAGALGLSAAEQIKIVPISHQVALIEERTGAKVKRYGQMFKLNPEVSDIADNYATMHNGVALLVLGAVEDGGSGCACPESVLIKALVTDLVLYKDDALIMDMEAGIEHLGRATARGVNSMVVVVEPGQNSIECAQRIIRMTQQIGIKHLCFVANKVKDEADEKFIMEALTGHDILEFIPYSEEIRKADRVGQSAIEALSPEISAKFENILSKLDELERG
jgi:CO dehydrogenase maturation factor